MPSRAFASAPPTGNLMPSLMPSLFKYFTIVGAVLITGLIGLNAVLEPGGPGPTIVKQQPKPKVRFDPGASLVERLRAEEAAQKAATQEAAAQTQPNKPAAKAEPRPELKPEPKITPQQTAVAAATPPAPSIPKVNPAPVAPAQPQPLAQATLAPEPVTQAA